MDPLSIYGATVTSFELFGQFVQICRRFGELPRRVDAVNTTFKGQIYALRDWKHKFRVEQQRPFVYYQLLWGKEEPEVRRLLNKLQNCCEEVKKKIETMIGKQVPDVRRDIYRGRIDQGAMEDAVRQISKNFRPWKRLTWAVKDEAKNLEDDLRGFTTNLTALKEISFGAFRDEHNEDLEHFNPARLVGKALLYKQTRKNAQMLYAAYKHERDPIKCYLVLDPLVMHRRHASRDAEPRPPNRGQNAQGSQQLGLYQPPRRPRARSEGDVGSQSLTVYRSSRSPGIRYEENVNEVDKKRHFQFLLQYRGNSHPIVIRPVSFKGTSRALRQVITCDSFIGIIAELNQDDICTLQAPVPDRKQFRIQQYDHPALVQLHRSTSLESRLASLSYKDKCQIAYAVADGLFRMFGSSWGNYLQRPNLKTTQANGKQWAIGLEAEPKDPILRDVLDYAELGFQHTGVNLTHHAQIFRLGVVLAELGLGRSLRTIRLNEERSFQLDFGLGERSTWLVSCDVVRKTSNSYGKVVSFCLSVYERGNLTERDNLDHEFETSVLDPLEKLHDV